MQQDKFSLEILPDGTIKTTTDAVSAANHDNAESFLRTIAKLAGGIFTRKIREDLPKHVHRNQIEEHEKEHAHGTHTHANGITHSH